MDERYATFSDEELIDRIRDGEGQLIDYLMDKYKNLVRHKAKSMFLLGGDADDLIQEGMIGLFKAVRDYDPGRDASFYTFAELCVSRQMYTAVQASGRKKHAPLNTYISLYTNMADHHEEEEASLVNALAAITEQSPEEQLIDQENVQKLLDIIERELSGFEKQVLELYMTGMPYTEIARILRRDVKSTDNALQRIKGKIRRELKKND